MARQPNVILVITDDQGYPPMSCLGHPYIETPNLDRFHGESAHMTQFHTGTTCAPTRAGLLTGHYCNSTGVWHTIGGRSLLRRNEWTLATALRDSGYRTGMFGKWHLGDNFPYRPQDRGFDEVVCHGGGGISQQPDWWGNDYFDDTYMVNGEPKAFEGYCTDVFFDEAIRFVEANKEAPFFCYLSTNAPHGPFNIAAEYWKRYAEEAHSESYARFLGMITNIDHNFGRLESALQDAGIADDTILIFMSDNGQTGVGKDEPDMYRAGMRGLKGDPYDGGHRVPFFIRWTNGAVGEVGDIGELSAYVDAMPTLLELCGVAVPEARSFHGESLASLLHGESSPHWKERIISTDTQRIAHPLKWRLSCTMQDRWRLVNGSELYDIDADPGQENNIADAHPDRVAVLRQGYEHWWTQCTEDTDAEIPISVGGEENPTCLRTHDLRNDDVQTVWNQGQVRRAVRCTGHWEIDVEQAGTYAFELSRWPEESGHALGHGFEGADMGYDEEGVAPGAERQYRDGVAMDIQTATLLISGGVRETVQVDPGAARARIEVTLEPGVRHLRGIFSGPTGPETSAYYVYARKLDDAELTTA